MSRSGSTGRFRLCRRVAPALLVGVLATHSHGAEGDPVNFEVFASQRHDSNLFRLPDGVLPNGNGRRSATTQTTGVGLHVDKGYSLQRFVVDAVVTHARYDPYHNLDFTGRALSSAYYWNLTSSLTGNLIYNKSELPTDFADAGLQQRPNPRKSELKRLDVDWRPGAAWHPRISAFEVVDKSDRPVLQLANSRATSIELSVIHDFRSGKRADGYVRRARGNYVDLNPDPSRPNDPQFNEREVGLRGTWQVTGLSKLDANVGYLDRTHATDRARNFNGVVGRLVYVYTTTGKTELQLAASRSLSSSQMLASSYAEDQTYVFSPVWSATGKLTVRPAYSVNRRVFKGAPYPSSDALRQTTRAASLQIDWAALRSIDVSFVLSRSTRSADDPRLQYVDRSVSIFARLKF